MLVKTSAHKSFGALIQYLKVEVFYALIFSTVIYYLYEHRNLEFLASFSFIPLSFFGAILSVFLAFRNNNSYSRWWEARQLWGDLVNSSRMLGMQIMTLVASPTPDYSSEREAGKICSVKMELIHRHLACVNLFRMQLREDFDYSQVDEWLDASDREKIRQAVNPGTQLMLAQGQRLKECANEGFITDYQLVALMGTIERFYNILGGCERIKNTPFPREYDAFIRYLLWILISIVPIYFLGIFSDDISKILIIPITVGVTLILGFANKAGELMEDPFENRMHDVPMTALCNTIERDLLQQLGSQCELPKKAQVENNVIW